MTRRCGSHLCSRPRALSKRQRTGAVQDLAESLLLVNFFASARVMATQEPEVEQDVKVFAVSQRGRIIRSGRRLVPGDELVAGFAGLEADVAGGARLDREDWPHFVADVAG